MEGRRRRRVVIPVTIIVIHRFILLFRMFINLVVVVVFIHGGGMVRADQPPRSLPGHALVIGRKCRRGPRRGGAGGGREPYIF